MALQNVYTQSYGQIKDLLQKIKDGQAPEKFTTQHLKDIGLASSNHRAYIPILKAIGFLSSEGVPTEKYKNYRNTAMSRQVLGEALREAYSDIFTISNDPLKADRKLIEGKFKSEFNATENTATLMTNTFINLLKEADIKPESKQTQQEFKHIEAEPSLEKEFKKDLKTSFNYNIEIHLPATKDVEVYNAIFKALKEQLF